MAGRALLYVYIYKPSVQLLLGRTAKQNAHIQQQEEQQTLPKCLLKRGDVSSSLERAYSGRNGLRRLLHEFTKNERLQCKASAQQRLGPHLICPISRHVPDIQVIPRPLTCNRQTLQHQPGCSPRALSYQTLLPQYSEWRHRCGHCPHSSTACTLSAVPRLWAYPEAGYDRAASKTFFTKRLITSVTNGR